MGVFTLEEQQQINDTFAMMQERILAWGERKGWNQNLEDRSFGDWCALLVSEISEAYEEYRNHRALREVWFNAAEGLPKVDKPETHADYMNKPEGIPVEFADLAIRLLHFFEYIQLNLGNCVVQKMDYNDLRSHRHGGKKI
jgi:hypothetical protein